MSELLKFLLNNAKPTDPITNFANYAHLDEEFAGNTSKLTDVDFYCWIIDTGATNHICADIALFSSYVEPVNSQFVHLPNGSKRVVKYIGVVKLNDSIILENVLYIPQFSVSQLCYHKLYTLQFTCSGCVLQDQATNQNQVMGVLFRKLYIYRQQIISSVPVSSIKFNNVSCSTSLHCNHFIWHNRMGHPSTQAIKHISAINSSDVNTELPCDTCHKAKQSRISFPLSTTRAQQVFDLVHMDLWGPYTAPTISGDTYILTLLDDHSRSLWIFLLQPKTQECQTLCKDLGIIHQSSCTYSPQQNGRVERKHRHLLNVARALLLQASLPTKFWGDSILTATFLINRTPTKLLGWKTPFETLHGYPPTYNHLRTFGSLCYATNTTPHKPKFLPRVFKCIMIGYAMTKKAYKLYDLENHCVLISRDVIFYESVFPYSTSGADSSNQYVPILPLCSDFHSSHLSEPAVPTPTVPKPPFTLSPSHEQTIASPVPSSPPLHRSSRQKHKPLWLDDFVSSSTVTSLLHSCSTAYMSFVTSLSILQEPKLYSEVVKYVEWRDAMQAKLMLWSRTRLGSLCLCQWENTLLDVNGYLRLNLKLMLERSLYGLKQASQQWNVELTLKLTEFGFVQSGHDHCLFTKRTSMGLMALLVYVDDILVTAPSLDNIRRLIGRLLYFGFTWPDIFFNSNSVQFLNRPCDAHWKAALHVVRYLKGCPSKGLFLPSHSNLELHAFCDADWASCTDSRSSLTGLHLLRECDHFLKNQETNNYFGVSLHSPIKLFCDNQAALHIMANSVFHERFGSVRVRSFRLPSPDLGPRHEIGRRFPSWTRHLCLLLEPRYAELLDIGTSYPIRATTVATASPSKHISKCIGDTSVMIQSSCARDYRDSLSSRTTPVLSELGTRIIPTKPPRLPYDDPASQFYRVDT
ncbi:UNVERIFIED_CONTAM: Copia protein [Sesamum latifolium]|uniref:Copia protein n=1 Tax=Sesamum latifolium TaxID=2727402 RepID=A0AAW2WS26_9LAMI